MSAAITVPAGIKAASALQNYTLRDALVNTQLVPTRRTFSTVRLTPIRQSEQTTAQAVYPAGLESDAEVHALTRAIQIELIRVGCYGGRISGSWDIATKSAAEQFLAVHNSVLPLNGPDPVLWHMLDKSSDQVCVAECPIEDQGSGSNLCGVPVALKASIQSVAAIIQAGDDDARTQPAQLPRPSAHQPAEVGRKRLAETGGRAINPAPTLKPAPAPTARVAESEKDKPEQIAQKRMHITTSAGPTTIPSEKLVMPTVSPPAVVKPIRQSPEIDRTRNDRTAPTETSDFGRTFFLNRASEMR